MAQPTKSTLTFWLAAVVVNGTDNPVSIYDEDEVTTSLVIVDVAVYVEALASPRVTITYLHSYTQDSSAP